MVSSAPCIQTIRIDRLVAVHPDPIWLRGELPEISQERPAIAIVGARAATRGGMERAYRLAGELAARGLAVISGGALGIDAAAHRGALASDVGKTIAVLGCGVDIAYPVRHRMLFEQIAWGHGALLSPFAPGTQPLRWNFPRRNRLIAALGHGVVVVEAQGRSGALGTAREARELGGRVMAMPGSPGSDALLSAGAFAVQSADDVLAALEGRRRSRPLPEGELGLALSVLVGPDALTVGEVAQSAHLPVPKAHAALLRLTLMGYVARLPGERYKRLEMVA
jgi:DNA processing protein